MSAQDACGALAVDICPEDSASCDCSWHDNARRARAHNAAIEREDADAEAASLVALAFKFGALSARTDQFRSAVDGLLEFLRATGVQVPARVLDPVLKTSAAAKAAGAVL